MSGETEANVSGWTTDTLRTHLLALIDERNTRYEQRFEAQEKAVTKAEVAAEKRFESVNEFRAQLGDQAGQFLTRDVYNGAHQALIDKIDTISSRIDRMEGRSNGLGAGWGYIAAAAGLMIAIASVVLAAVH